MAIMSGLKSLAHPDWPYAGTAHEWRGFVKNEGRYYAPVTPINPKHAERMEELKAIYQKQKFGPELP
jgi:hypothetical protein